MSKTAPRPYTIDV